MHSVRSQIKKKAEEKRQKVNRLKHNVGLVLTFVIVAGFVALMNAPFLRYDFSQFSVSGKFSENPKNIRAFAASFMSGDYLYLVPRDSIFFFSEDNFVSALRQKFPRLDDIEVKKPEWRVMAVSAEDKEIKVLWCASDVKTGCFYVDDSGQIYSPAPKFSDNVLFEIRGTLPSDPLGKRVIASSSIQSMIFLSDYAVKKDLADNRAFMAEMMPAGDVALIFGAASSTWKLLYNDKTSARDLADNLNSISNNADFRSDLSTSGKSLEYLDLRFGKKVFYKVK